MDTCSRFMALPRARKGTTTVVIVEESVLAELIADAQASEGDLMRQSSGPLTTISGGATGGAPTQIQVHVDPLSPPPEVTAEDIRLGRRARAVRSSRWWILRLLPLPRPPRCGDDECVDNHG